MPTAPRKFKKAYGFGGQADASDPNQLNAITSSGLAATSLVGSVADAYDSGNKYGRQNGITTGLKQGASMAATGAKIGGMFGPEGALIGAGVGFVGGVASGLIGASGAHRKEMAQDRYTNATREVNETNAGSARIGADPSLVYGNRSAQNFALGGDTKPGAKPTASPNLQAEWNGFQTFLQKKGVAGSTTLDSHDINLGKQYLDEYRSTRPNLTLNYDSVGRVQQGLQDYKQTVWNRATKGSATIPGVKGYDDFMPGISPVDNWLGSKTSSSRFPITQFNGSFIGLSNPNQTAAQEAQASGKLKLGGSIIHKHNRPTNNGAFSDYSGSGIYANGGQTPPNEVQSDTQQAPGGSLTPMSNNSFQVNGNSHAEGGVQLPNAEVEGGESIANGFVFSKTLGFAQLHKPIAKAIGKVEDKPMNPIRRRTLEILQGREQGLAISQEMFKKNLGIPSNIQ